MKRHNYSKSTFMDCVALMSQLLYVSINILSLQACCKLPTPTATSKCFSLIE